MNILDIQINENHTFAPDLRPDKFYDVTVTSDNCIAFKSTTPLPLWMVGQLFGDNWYKILEERERDHEASRLQEEHEAHAHED